LKNNSIIFIFLFPIQTIFCQSYPDQIYQLVGGLELLANAEQMQNVVMSSDSSGLILSEDNLEGSVTFNVQYSTDPFNRGLPSWNGYGSDSAGFKVFIRFPVGYNWSSWLTVGYWKNHIWQNYGNTSFSEGEIDIDYAILYNYKSSWQYKIILKRESFSNPCPSIEKLVFLASDSRTTENVDHNALLNDNPPECFIPTTFIYQYSVDPNIGDKICSPTSVCMTIMSFGIGVDPLQFALDTYDPIFDIFGGWPRVVQNAHEYGLDGYVSRYRSWSEVYEVLQAEGRVVITVGYPLYPNGHLMMFAGFDSSGNPIVHDPARNDGYAYEFDKYELGKSWFDKGGISYTFFSETQSAIDERGVSSVFPEDIVILKNYPNPFNRNTTIVYFISELVKIEAIIFNILGDEINNLYKGIIVPGTHTISWNGKDNTGNAVSSGIYVFQIKTTNNVKSENVTFLK